MGRNSCLGFSLSIQKENLVVQSISMLNIFPKLLNWYNCRVISCGGCII